MANGAQWFHGKKEHKNAPEVDDSEYFNNMNFHRMTIEQIDRTLDTSHQLGLDTLTATKRLQQNGPNVLLQRSSSYVWKILGYVFGQFCSVLWVGAIVFFLCWQPLSTPPIVPDGVPSVQNLALGILVVCKTHWFAMKLSILILHPFISLSDLRHIFPGFLFGISGLVNISGHEINSQSIAFRMHCGERWANLKDFSQPIGNWRYRTC